jgi:predicted ArsR family transcriptional regulator
MSVRDFATRVTSVSALAEPVRRALYLYVVGQPRPVSREEAAAAVGVAHHVAKFNLDKLEDEELLEVEYARPAGRRGPGAGRPAKLYKRSAREVEVSLPERRYDLAANVLAEAITQSKDNDVPIDEALRDAATEAGRALGAQAKQKPGSRRGQLWNLRAAQEVLADIGYEPRPEGTGLTLANCPFHALAKAHTATVCGINRQLIDSLLQAAGVGDAVAELSPAPDRCCVRVVKK